MTTTTPQKELANAILHSLRMITNTQAILHDLHDRLHLPEIVDIQERLKHAEAYEGTAGVLRRRAKSENETDRVDSERRAAWFEARARVMRAGTVMPRELRTDLEKLGIIGRIREDLAHLVEFCHEVSSEDLGAFVDALLPAEQASHEVGLQRVSFGLRLQDEHGNPAAPSRDQIVAAFGEFRGAALDFLAQLGAYTDAAGQLLWPRFGMQMAEVQETADEPAKSNGATQ